MSIKNMLAEIIINSQPSIEVNRYMINFSLLSKHTMEFGIIKQTF